MHNLKKLFLIFLFILFLPQAKAQVEITSYNITYSLQKNGINITEIILFSNPEKSVVHTFMEDIVLERRGAEKESIAIEGMESGKSGDGRFIYLYFSKDWLIKPSTRRITISYFVPSVQPAGAEAGAEELEVLKFSGRLLLSLPFTPKEANVIVKTPDNYEFGALPYFGRRIRKDLHEEILYEYRGELIKTNPFIEIEYGNFKSAGESYVKNAKRAIEESTKKIEQINQTLILSASYNITFQEVESRLKEILNLLNASQYYLSLYSTASENENFYAAFGFANLSKISAQKALETSEEAGTLLNLRFQAELREKLSELEKMRSNLSSLNLSQYNLPYSPQKNSSTFIENISTETPSQTAPPPIAQPSPEQGKMAVKALAYYFPAYYFIAIFLLVFGIFYFAFLRRQRKEEREEKKTMEFPSIRELKRKKFSDFEKKIARVKNESEIAEEIMKLRSEKEKYVLAIQHLEKKLSAYEISEHDFVVEREKFEKKISDIEIKLKELESEIKPK